MLKLRYFYLIFLINTISAFDQDPTYLVLNRFDRPIPEIDQSLIDNFSQSSFDFNSSVEDLFGDLDSHENPAAKYMEKIKELGDIYNVNFILLNRIQHKDDRLIMDGMLFNTRSGGLIHRRKINLKNYTEGSMNELNLWIGNTMGKVDKEWEKERESILFLDPDNITYEKTPMGAAIRSLFIPGWGQAYSGNKLSAGLWASFEASLSIAFILSYNNYDTAAKSYLNNLKLYDATDDEKEVSSYRGAAEKDWDDHVMYSKLAIALGTTAVTGWVTNSIHAWVFGPRPYTNIYQKGISGSTIPSG